MASLPAALLAAAAGRRRAAKANGHNGSGTSAHHRRRSPAGDNDDWASARLRLLEGFLSRTEIADSVPYALQWLGEVVGVTRSVCLVRPTSEPALITVASYGLPSAATTSSRSPLTTGAIRSRPR